MANFQHVKVLKQGVRVWNRWRNENPDIYFDLSDTSFNGANLKEIELIKGNLCRAVLSRANLSDAKLFESNLQEADLTHCDLQGADLSETNLSGATVGGANLREANLFAANLFKTDLRAANLFSATLYRANISGTYLRGASLQEAGLGDTTFALTTLRQVQALDTCDHYGRSSIDYQTLIVSGPLPSVFLRGCGLPDEFIHYLPSFWDNPLSFYSCFISYSHADKAFAQRLHDALQARGIRCWLDEHQLLPGDDIHERIEQGIQLWDKVLLCCSESSLTSWWVDSEINRAFQKEAQLMKERGKKVLALIPLNLDGYLFSDQYESGKKSEIKSRMAGNFVGWQNENALFERELEKVIRALKPNDTGREQAPKQQL